MISDSVFGYHFVRQQLLVPWFFSRPRWFSSSLYLRIPFFATFCIFVLWHHCLPELLMIEYDWVKSKTCTNLNNNLYQCLKIIYSYNMVLLLLTTSPYKMSLHTVLSFLMFNNSTLTIQKASKKQSRWSDKMSWPLKTLTQWRLQNVQFCLLGVLLQNALVRGFLATTKCPYINHL